MTDKERKIKRWMLNGKPTPYLTDGERIWREDGKPVMILTAEGEKKL